MGKIVRILNHNAVIVHDAQDNRVLLLLDKGIGFGKKINEQMDPPYSGKIYELQKETSKGPTKDVLNHLEPQYLEISSEILTLAEEKFHDIDRNILLPLADHIAFAITRIKSGMNITNPFVNDITMLYPEEAARSFMNAAVMRSMKTRSVISRFTFTVPWVNRWMRACWLPLSSMKAFSR